MVSTFKTNIRIPLECVYLVALVVLALWYAGSPDFRNLLPLRIGDPKGVSIPIQVAWWGSIGAVTARIVDLTTKRQDQLTNGMWWYILSPLTGGLYGVVAFVILAVISAAEQAGPNTNNNFFYDISAFLIAYNEKLFHDLLKRTADFLLAGGQLGAEQWEYLDYAVPLSITKTNPAEIEKLATDAINAQLRLQARHGWEADEDPSFWVLMKKGRVRYDTRASTYTGVVVRLRRLK